MFSFLEVPYCYCQFDLRSHADDGVFIDEWWLIAFQIGSRCTDFASLFLGLCTIDFILASYTNMASLKKKKKIKFYFERKENVFQRFPITKLRKPF